MQELGRKVRGRPRRRVADRAYKADPARRLRARAQGRAWYVANRERVRAEKRANAAKENLWKRTAKARRRRACVEPFSPQEWAAVVAFYGGRCAYCGDPWQHIEHVVPVSRGGVHGLRNLVPACARCNLTKHTATWAPAVRHPWMEAA